MLSAYWYTFLWSLTPILELRGSIPIGVGLGLSIPGAILISSLGVIISGTIVLLILPQAERFAARYIPWAYRILLKIFERTRAEHSRKLEMAGEVFLVTFIAIPLPGSGVWTGALICHLFGIPFRQAILLLAAGVLFSGAIVGGITYFGFEIFNALSAPAVAEIP